MPGQTGPKFTKTERKQKMFEIAKLDRRGYTLHEISKRVGMSYVMVHKYLKKIQKTYETATILTHDYKVQEMISKKLEILKELWEAWERSKEDKERIEEEEVSYDDEDSYNSNSTKTKTIREGRLPEVQYMKLARDILKDICAITGMSLPEFANVSHVEKFNFIEIAEKLSQEDPFDIAVRQLPSPEERVEDEED